jgi:hypothetical protein
MSAPPDVLGPAIHQLTNGAFRPRWRPNGPATAGDATPNAPLSVPPRPGPHGPPGDSRFAQRRAQRPGAAATHPRHELGSPAVSCAWPREEVRAGIDIGAAA